MNGEQTILYMTAIIVLLTIPHLQPYAWWIGIIWSILLIFNVS
jgi:hypothetical protein